MSKHIRVENNEVVECLDYLPDNATGDWRIAIQVIPNLIPGRQIVNSYYFDLTKDPVEIVPVITNISEQERKLFLQQKLNVIYEKLVSKELKKEFSGNQSDINVVTAYIQEYRIKKTEIEALQTHEEIDQYILQNE